jgi:hypothetical protein
VLSAFLLPRNFSKPEGDIATANQLKLKKSVPRRKYEMLTYAEKRGVDLRSGGTDDFLNLW